MTWTAAALLLPALMFVATRGNATSSDPYLYAQAGSDWVIDLQSAEKEVSVKKGGTVFKAPIYPTSLFRTGEAAVEAATGNLVFDAGSQVVRHRLATGERVYCSTSDGGFLRNSIFICFEDADNDGKLDRYYHVLSRFISGSPFIDTGKSGIHTRIRPVSIAQIDPREIDNPAALELTWAGTVSSKHMFATMSLTSKKGKRLYLTNSLRLPIDGTPNFALPHLTFVVTSTQPRAVTVSVRKSREFIGIRTMGSQVQIVGE